MTPGARWTCWSGSLCGGEPPNQDAICVDPGRGVFVLADGLGTYAGSEIASRTAVEACLEALVEPWPEEAEARRGWLGAIPRRVAQRVHVAGQQAGQPSMACTLTALKLVGLEAALLHVGDSRAYRWRGGELTQLTRDHSLAWEQYEAGALPKAALRDHPNQRLLTRTLTATRDFVIADQVWETAAADDLYLLCSDGLTKSLEDDAIAQILGAQPPVEAGERLLREGLRDDDLSLVLVWSEVA